MKVLHNDDATDFETELRLALYRRTTELNPDPPEWEELIQRTEPVAMSLPADDLDDRARRRDAVARRPRPRPVLAAAAIAAVVVAAGVAVNQTRSSDTTELSTTPASFRAAAPTDADFDASTAPAVWASDLTDPVEAATAYLAATGVTSAAGDLPVDAQPNVRLLEGDSEDIAAVEWSVDTATDAVGTGGTLYLRRAVVDQVQGAAQGAAATAWTVVGAAADDIALADVAYQDGQLSFSLSTAGATTGLLSVSVVSDGDQVTVDGDNIVDPSEVAGRAQRAAAAALATADGATGGTVGQLVELSGTGDTAAQLTAAVADASTTVIRVQQLVDDRVASVTEMAVALPGSDATAAADMAGSGDVDADAKVGTGGGTDTQADADATVDAEAGGGNDGSVGVDTGELGDVADDAKDTVDDLLDGTEVPTPGGGKVTTPSIPTTLPSVPGVPTPPLDDDLP